MHPILFNFEGVTIYSYGSILALGFGAGMVLILLKGRKQGIPLERMAELFCLLIGSAIVGARGLHVLLNLQIFLKDPMGIFRLSEGGLVFYGGFLFALVSAITYIRLHRLPFWKIADLFTPSIALGLFFARIGCFMAGCCYGKKTNLPWGVIFTDPSSLAPRQICLHPTQLYEAAGGFFIFFFLIGMEKKKSYPGQIFWLFLLVYSVLRFFLEFLRDDPRGFLLTDMLSTSQSIGVILAVVSIFMLFFKDWTFGRKERNGRAGNLEIPSSGPKKAL